MGKDTIDRAPEIVAHLAFAGANVPIASYRRTIRDGLELIEALLKERERRVRHDPA